MSKPTKFQRFIDIFGGGFAIDVYYIRTYKNILVYHNDICPDLTAFFESLKDECRAKELVDIMILKDYNRHVFYMILKDYITSYIKLNYKTNYITLKDRYSYLFNSIEPHSIESQCLERRKPNDERYC